MTFSGVNCSLNSFSANNRRLSTNWRMRATASSFLMWKGSTASGTAPFGHLLVDAEDVAAPVAARRHRVFGIDRHLGAAAGALEASSGWRRRPRCPAHRRRRPCPRARRGPRRSRIPPRPAAPCHSWRQYWQTSRSLPALCRMSVAPHFGQRLRPSLSSSADVSMATGSGASQFLADRTGQRGRVDRRTRRAPAARPAATRGRCTAAAAAALAFDMVGARIAAYRPSTLALSASKSACVIRPRSSISLAFFSLATGSSAAGAAGADRLLHAADAAHHAAGHAHAHEARRTAVLARRLHARGDAGLQVGIAARTGQRVGALHGLEQFPRVRVVLDRHDGGLDDDQAAIGLPLVGVLHRSRTGSWRSRPNPAAAW